MNSMIEKKIFAHGLKTAIKWNSKYKVPDIVKNFPDLVEEALSYYDPHTLSEVATAFSVHAPERMSEERWVLRFEESIKDVDFSEIKKFCSANHYHIDYRLVSLYFEGVKVLKLAGKLENSWSEIFERFKEPIRLNKNIGHNLVPYVAFEFFKENPEKARKFMYDVNFKTLNSTLRTAYFKAYIKAGLLDKKIARRIRSDNSEHTSTQTINYLLENLDIYDNPKSLLTQFVDIKHSSAQYKMAKYAPDYMVPFMMGFDDPAAKSVLELRALEITKAKEAENNNG